MQGAALDQTAPKPSINNSPPRRQRIQREGSNCLRIAPAKRVAALIDGANNYAARRRRSAG
jgi:hypothetical protein